MIILAHDGSLYGDWVARYALHFAAAEVDRKLLLLHVADGRVDPELAQARFTHFAAECAAAGVVCRPELLPGSTSVHRALCQATPRDPQALLVCGTRVKPQRRDFLAGSVAEQLLRGHHCPVLALRVVQPGLLGLPHELLAPLAGHAGGFARLAPILLRFLPQLRRLYFLHAVPVNPLVQPHRSQSRRDGLLQGGRDYLERVATELAERFGPPSFAVDRRVLLAADPAQLILVEASRLKAQLLLLGASERSLAHRVFHGQALERMLRDAPCDVGIYRGP